MIEQKVYYILAPYLDPVPVQAADNTPLPTVSYTITDAKPHDMNTQGTFTKVRATVDVEVHTVNLDQNKQVCEEIRERVHNYSGNGVCHATFLTESRTEAERGYYGVQTYNIVAEPD